MSNDNLTVIESLKESYDIHNDHYSRAQYVYCMEPTSVNERRERGECRAAKGHRSEATTRRSRSSRGS